MKDIKGFSLLELMVVVIIVGILAGMSVFGYRNFTIKNEINNQIMAIYGDLVKLRMMAMRNNKMTFMELTSDNYIGYVDTNENEVLDTGVDAIILQANQNPDVLLHLKACFPILYLLVEEDLLVLIQGAFQTHHAQSAYSRMLIQHTIALRCLKQRLI